MSTNKRTADRRQADRRHDDSSKLAKLQADSGMLDEYLREQFGDDDAAIEAWIERMHKITNDRWRARGWTPFVEVKK